MLRPAFAASTSDADAQRLHVRHVSLLPPQGRNVRCRGRVRWHGQGKPVFFWKLRVLCTGIADTDAHSGTRVPRELSVLASRWRLHVTWRMQRLDQVRHLRIRRMRVLCARIADTHTNSVSVSDANAYAFSVSVSITDAFPTGVRSDVRLPPPGR